MFIGKASPPVNIWAIQKRASERSFNQLGGKKLSAKPTKEQLESIEKSQREESKELKNNPNLVAIDWDYIKETINLTSEEKKIRAKQDKLELDIDYYGKMAEVEDKYQADLAKIEAGSEDRLRQNKAKDKAKANAIIRNIAKGMMVSPFDLAFANSIAPEKVAKALRDAEKSNNKGYNNILMSEMINSMDYKI